MNEKSSRMKTFLHSKINTVSKRVHVFTGATLPRRAGNFPKGGLFHGICPREGLFVFKEGPNLFHEGKILHGLKLFQGTLPQRKSFFFDKSNTVARGAPEASGACGSTWHGAAFTELFYPPTSSKHFPDDKQTLSSPIALAGVIHDSFPQH